MKQTVLGFLLIAGCAFLAGCGAREEGSTVSPVIKADVKNTEQSSNNPLAAQQQLIRDAKEIQGILNQDAQEKKAAINSAN